MAIVPKEVEWPRRKHRHYCLLLKERNDSMAFPFKFAELAGWGCGIWLLGECGEARDHWISQWLGTSFSLSKITSLTQAMICHSHIVYLCAQVDTLTPPNLCWFGARLAAAVSYLRINALDLVLQTEHELCTCVISVHCHSKWCVMNVYTGQSTFLTMLQYDLIQSSNQEKSKALHAHAFWRWFKFIVK